MSKKIAVIGATGQVGTPMVKSLLENGHQVLAISRAKNPGNKSKLEALEAQGASLAFCSDYSDVDAMAKILEGSDILVASVQANKSFLVDVQPKILEAAIKAGVKRFVPNEFGAHTMGMPWGAGVVFDYKKQFQELLMKSGIEWTLFYNGGIFDYFLPNLRFFDKITTFGDIDLPIYTHQIQDIGQVAALAVVDDRTANRCVQMDYNHLTQAEMLDLLTRSWPNHSFEYTHYSTEYIMDMKENAGDEITAKRGEETDKERWGINYICYVAGKLASFDEHTLRSSELYPDYVCIKPESAIQDADFVFEQPK